MLLPEAGKIQDPVHGQGDRRVDQLLRERIVKLHAKDHQRVVLPPQRSVHAVDEVAVVLVVQVVDDHGDHPAAPGAQRRGHGVGDVAHFFGCLPNQPARRFRQHGVVSQCAGDGIGGVAAGEGDILQRYARRAHFLPLFRQK